MWVVGACLVSRVDLVMEGALGFPESAFTLSHGTSLLSWPC